VTKDRPTKANDNLAGPSDKKGPDGYRNEAKLHLPIWAGAAFLFLRFTQGEGKQWNGC